MPKFGNSPLPGNRILQTLLATAKKGGMRSDLVDELLDAAQTIDATPLNLEGLLPVKINDWPCIIEAGAQLGVFSDICYVMRNWADEEEVPVRFSVTGAVWVAFPGEPMPVAEPAQHVRGVSLGTLWGVQ